MGDKPISEYGMLSDRHSAALVSLDGSVDWLCFPRFDSPAVFAGLLGQGAGHWAIRPATPASVSRRYLDGTLVLRTRFITDGGEMTLTDALVTGPDGDPHRLGEGAPHALVREATCTQGSVEVLFDFRPRPEYGLIVPLISPHKGGVMVRGGATRLLLSSPIELSLTDGSAGSVLNLHSGQSLRFALRWSTLSAPADETPWNQDEIGDRIAMTVNGWRAWSQVHQNYKGPWEELVRHSGRVLHGLGYQPTGAIVAAVTTSLPETIGGTRNWDYRYTWIRDSSFTLQALWVAACPDEAFDFFNFITSAAPTTRHARDLQIMYGIGGEHDLTERILNHLPGWSGSRPVRVGNDAWRQAQFDIYGELLATAGRYADALPDDPALHGFLIDLADIAARVWRQPDHGIWEIRGKPRHFVHSKLMCWVALREAVKLGPRIGAGERIEAWSAARDEIRAAIEEHGWSESAGAYTQSFGSDELDASVLMIPIVGFAAGNDPRVLSTVDAIAERLTDSHGLVHRYQAMSDVDGIGEPEGAFLLCTLWLARANALAGRIAKARRAFERAVSYANDLGLLAEQADPETGRMLGNFPQAFSHIGLINAAYAIAVAEGAGAGGGRVNRVTNRSA
jgi:GH15 family glucan-1,4-alpha-glucosidase